MGLSRQLAVFDAVGLAADIGMDGQRHDLLGILDELISLKFVAHHRQANLHWNGHVADLQFLFLGRYIDIDIGEINIDRGDRDRVNIGNTISSVSRVGSDV